MHPDWIVPDWDAAPGVGAILTSRNGGFSAGPFAGTQGGGMNVRFDLGDDPVAVAANRARLLELLPTVPVWLHQVHGTNVVDAATVDPDGPEPNADASFSRQPGVVCAVQTADCMPILFCDRLASVVAVAHAGWRGLAQGVIERTIEALDIAPRDVCVFLGPAIGPRAFEVGDDVLDAFRATTTGAESAFVSCKPGKWLADLELLARLRLAQMGVIQVTGGGRCTVSEPAHFYSFRRDRTTGRMAALIWIR
jgi:YfiH family protein